MALARELGVTLDALTGALTPRDGTTSTAGVSGIILFLPPAAPASLAVQMQAVAEVFLALENLCGAQKRALLPLYLPFVRDAAGIESVVAQVRHLLGVTHAVVFDYLELFENAGLRVVFAALPEGVHSAAAYDASNANAFLFIAVELTPEKQIFRLAYELGRIYVATQNLYGGGGVVAEPGTLDDEHTARKFAALFLMPAASVCSTVRQVGVTPAGWTYELLLRLKQRFGVSAEAFTIRLEELGLIELPLAVRFKAQIRAHYADKGFVEPDGSRRILTPNGRLGDLLLEATNRDALDTRPELATLRLTLQQHGVLAGLAPTSMGRSDAAVPATPAAARRPPRPRKRHP